MIAATGMVATGVCGGGGLVAGGESGTSGVGGGGGIGGRGGGGGGGGGTPGGTTGGIGGGATAGTSGTIPSVAPMSTTHNCCPGFTVSPSLTYNFLTTPGPGDITGIEVYGQERLIFKTCRRKKEKIRKIYYVHSFVFDVFQSRCKYYL